MDSTAINLTPAVILPDTTSNIQLPAGSQNNPEKTKQLAKDFESVLLSQIVNSMKDTISSLNGDDEEAGSGQVKDMFWMCLSREVGDKGGMGLWKDLYQFFNDMQKKQNLTAGNTETAENNSKLNSASGVSRPQAASAVWATESEDNPEQILDENL